VDLFIDLHEAELQYPVISTIVAHDSGEELAAFTSMMLSDTEFNIGMEYSPATLHGLSHREVGDHSDAVSLLFEAPEPFLDATRGKTTREQLLTGKDEFVMKAGEAGLLFEEIDETGWPMDKRVGRHTSTVRMTLDLWSELNPDRPMRARGIPRYDEILESGLGRWLRDPAAAPPERIVVE
ncbi:MAG: succinylglutamate desuccinylase, partial [Gemmatimonadetes bacterium]|nr:succinylglutamate desuccinylase [Gemmatimonadota bacterium]